MGYNKEVLEHQYPIVQLFVEHLAFSRGLRAGWNQASTPSLFWSLTVKAHLHMALIEWCKVFGAYSEDTHWTKTPTGKTAQQVNENFRQKIYEKTGHLPDEWKTYHDSIVNMRGKYAVHLDLDKPIKGTVPVFDVALKVAYPFEEWRNEIIKQIPGRPLTLEGICDDRMKIAFSIASDIHIPKHQH